MGISQTRDVRLELRLTKDVKSLLQQAAGAEGKKLSEFVVDSARHEAVDVIADRHVFQLDPQQMSEFENILNRPVWDNPKLQRLLTEKTIF